ncbi:MAG: hypothetical protein QNJ98_19135 [Planctomycetota bacterium]|nr:hypothetical protein [Planctomycetota bacterium]
MSRVLSLITFSIESCHKDEFLRRAKEELKPYWEANGSERYEVYEEMGPQGPTGRLVELNILSDRDAYQRMSQFVRQAGNLPNVAYRHVREPNFQVMELVV